MHLYSLISIMHAQFGTSPSTKSLKLIYKFFKSNGKVSALS